MRRIHPNLAGAIYYGVCRKQMINPGGNNENNN